MPALKNEKWERFCQLLLIDPEANASRSYRAVGYTARGSAADVGASRLLKNDKVAHRLQELRDARAKRTEITADRVLTELALLGFSNLSDYRVDDVGEVVLKTDNGPGALRALSSLRHKTRSYERDGLTVTEHDVEMKLWSKTKALDMLARHLGLFEDKATLVQQNNQLNVFVQSALGPLELPEL